MTGFVGLVAVVLLVWCLCSRSKTGRAAMGRSVKVQGHAHVHSGRGPHRASRHESGHASAARAVGGKIHSAEVFDDGTGFVHATVPDARAEIVFLAAGQIAHGSSAGAGADNAAIKRTLKEFPAKERAAVKAEGYKRARKIVRQRSGEIRRYTNKLNKKGHL